MRTLWLKRIALLLGAFFVGLAVVELSARIFYNPKFGYIPLAHDPVLGHRLLAGWEGWDEKEDYRVWVKINSWGFRDAEFDTPKIPGKRRMVILGDSYMFGTGAPQDQILARQLDHRLNGADLNLQVMNFAAKAWGPDQYLLLYEQQVRALKPDILFISLMQFNDPENLVSAMAKPRFTLDAAGALVYQPPAAPKAPGPAPEETTALGKFKKHVLREHSAAYQWIRGYVRNMRVDIGLALHRMGLVQTNPTANLHHYAPYYRVPQPEKVDESYRIMGAVMRKFKALADRDGVEIRVIVTPTPEVIDERIWNAWAGMIHQIVDPQAVLDRDISRKRIDGILDEVGIRYLDLTDPIRGEFRAHPDRKMYLPLDGHWNGHGHEVAGRIVGDWLIKELSRKHAG